VFMRFSIQWLTGGEDEPTCQAGSGR